MPARPEGVTDEDIVRGLYRFRPAPELPRRARRAATILAGGSIMQQALRAQEMLAEQFGVAAEVWSAPSYQLLRNEALEVDRWNLLHPGRAAARRRSSAQLLARARRPRADRRGQRLDPRVAGHDRALGARRSRGAPWAPTASAAATPARRCAASSRSTRSTSRRAVLSELARCGQVTDRGGARGASRSWASTPRRRSR